VRPGQVLLPELAVCFPVERADGEGGPGLFDQRRARYRGFSRTLRAVVALLCGVQDASSQELKAGSAIHRPLDHLDTVNLAFGGARGPGQVESRLHSGQVAPQACGEAGQRGAGRAVEHRAQVLLAPVAQQQVQPLRDGDTVRKAGNLRKQMDDQRPLRLGQRLGVGHEHASDLPPRGRLPGGKGRVPVWGALCRGLASLSRPPAHGSRPAGEAELDEFTPELRGIAAPFRPAAFKAIEMGGQNPGLWRFAPERGAAGMQPATDGLALGAKLEGNAGDGTACRMQPCRLLVAALAAGQGSLAAQGRRTRPGDVRLGRLHGFRRLGQLLADAQGSAPDGCMVAIDNGADDVTEVAQQMPAICDLDRVWGALAYAIGIRTGPVACDDLDPGMLAKPHGQGLGLPIGQKVDHGVALEIDQGSAIPMAAPPGPVIDGEDTRHRRPLVVVADAADQPQQRVRAGRHGQPLAQPPAGLAAECQADMALQAAQPLGSACASPGDTGQALGEGLAGTGRVKAAEPPRPDAQCHRATLPRQIGKRALVSTVEPLGRLATRRTRRRSLARTGVDGDGVRGWKDLIDGEAGRDQRQKALGQG
jgi:hypothetical protein